MHTLVRNLTTLARSLVLGGTFLLPLAFLPSSVAPLASVKAFVLFAIAYIPLLLFAAVSLLERKVAVPKHPITLGAVFVVVATGLATLFSSFAGQSFVGHGYERDTFAVITAVMALVLVVPWLFSSVRSLRTLFFALVGSFSVVAVFQILRLVVGSAWLFPSVFSTAVTISPVGNWNDLAVFAGMVVSAVVAFLFFYPTRRAHQAVMTAVLVAGLFVLAVVNVQVVWAMLAFVMFFLVMYRLSLMSIEPAAESGFFPERSPKAFIAAGVVFVCAVAFLLFGSFLGSRVGTVFNAQYVDVRPSWQGTVATSSSVYQDDMLLGSGPATFDAVWVATRDQGVNESLFWDADFSFGIGMIPTFFVTTGLVGGIAWLLLVGAWGYGVVQFLRTKTQDALAHATTLVWLTVSGYALAACVLYVPGMAMFALAGVSLGAFLAALVSIRIVEMPVLSTQHNALLAFTAPTALGVLVLVGAVVYVQGVRATVSTLYATRASYALSQNDTEQARTYAARSAFFAKTDENAQIDTALSFVDLNQALQQQSDEAAPDRALLQGLVERVVANAQEVTLRNPTNFRNWLFVANVYERIAGIVGNDALTSAATAYDEAAKRAPTSPLVPLLHARLAYGSGDVDAARAAIDKSLSLKSNYTDAYFLLSQLEIQEGNAQEAIQSTESAVLLAPNNPGLRFQLGFLLYASQDYQNAARILETAVTLNPNYANALYFLGLSYDRLSESEAATRAFAKVLELNPDNEEVQAIVNGLAEGVSAIQTLQNRQSVLPAQRDELPVSEESPVVE